MPSCPSINQMICTQHVYRTDIVTHYKCVFNAQYSVYSIGGSGPATCRQLCTISRIVPANASVSTVHTGTDSQQLSIALVNISNCIINSLL